MIEKSGSPMDFDRLSLDIPIAYADAVSLYSTKNYPPLIKEALRLIQSHLTSYMTLKDLASKLYVTEEHLSRLFKSHLNKGYSETVKQYKILEAKRLIEQGSYSFLEIANLLGFSSSSHFFTSFKQ